MRNTKLTLQLAEKPLRVDLDTMTGERAYDLFDKVAAIRIKTSPFSKYPKNEGETDEEWRKRISKEAETEQVRKDGEDVETHLKRIFDARHELLSLGHQILNAISETFNQGEISEARFKSGNWLAVKRFIYDVLSLADIPCQDFYTEELNK